MSRQTIDNWIASYRKYGLKGFINSTKENVGRPRGNKALEHERARKEKSAETDRISPTLFDVPVSAIQEVSDEQMPTEQEMPFSEESTTANRYSGAIIPMILLAHKWSWFHLIIGFFGKGYRIFQVFLLMAVKNIRSLEQMKNIRTKEGGNILGIGQLPSVTNLRYWFKKVSQTEISDKLKNTFFGWQLKNALVGTIFWFTDGHVLPYSGMQKLRNMFNTKRRLAEPGRTNMLTTDWSGRVVDFEIQEGKGDLRARIVSLHLKWKDSLEEAPVHVFDREGDGKEFFYELYSMKCPFVCWEKNINQQKLQSFGEADFTQKLSFNDTEYKYIKNRKAFHLETEQQTEQQKKISFELDRYYILNTKTGKRTSVLVNNVNGKLTDTDGITAILNRWGASENTNKYLNNRHPLHYQPGFKYTESENQLIPNPQIRELEKEIKTEKKACEKLYKKLASKEKQLNKSGTPRKNDAYSRLKTEVAELEGKITALQEQKKQLPEKIDISGLEDYKSYQMIDNHAKNLFDFVTAANWNARKEGVDILRKYYKNPNEVVDLYYAITNCSGKTQITKNQIIVTIEPLEQRSRRMAQIDFCRHLTALNVKTPDKKQFILQVAKN